MPGDRFPTINPRTALVFLAFVLLQIFGMYPVLLTLLSGGAILGF